MFIETTKLVLADFLIN